jgi:hypothetical protein
VRQQTEPFSPSGLRVMWPEMYVRDDEFSEVFEYLFGLIHEHLVRIQGAQTHMFLLKRKKPSN